MSLEEEFNDAYLVNDSPLFRRWQTSAEFHEQLCGADVVIGVDAATSSEQVLYGAGVLEEIIDSQRALRLLVLRVPLRLTTSEPEFLIAAVRVAKGLPLPDEGAP